VIKLTWQLWLSILFAIAAAGYVANFVVSNGYNRPALLFAWGGVLLSMLFYQRHRKSNANRIKLSEKEREEREFQQWSSRATFQEIPPEIPQSSDENSR